MLDLETPVRGPKASAAAAAARRTRKRAETPPPDMTFSRVNMSLLNAAMEVQDAGNTRCLNALSIPLLRPPSEVAGLAKLCELSEINCLLDQVVLLIRCN